jgi:squalene-hopene/tetraprenyl-beta-curcumene cyclase
MQPKTLLVVLIAAMALTLSPIATPAEPTTAPTVTPANATAEAQKLIDTGLDYLSSVQKPDGGWASEKEPPGITALVLRAMVQDQKHTTKNPLVKSGFDKLLSYQLESGGIYKDMLATYNTAIAVSALAAADDPALRPELDKAVAYLKSQQWTDRIVGPKGEKITDPTHANWAGGFGYGNHSRPDLSNTQFALQALHEAGLKENDEAFQNAIAFISRCQNRSESNDQPWAGNDGGFIYTPAGANSEAGSVTMPDGRSVPRSYGSMTYAGLKSMIYCGLTKDDPRVRAALGWIQRHWTFDENPGMGEADPTHAQHGLYYYFQTMGKALGAYQQAVLPDAQGAQHDWRVELIAKLASLQHPDGCWSGDHRWMENNPVIVTAYCVMAAEEARKSLVETPAH